jgi:Ni,Fe-hydrogenase III small subunit
VVSSQHLDLRQLQLQALLRHLDTLIRSGLVTEAQAEPLKTMVKRVIASISL